MSLLSESFLKNNEEFENDKNVVIEYMRSNNVSLRINYRRNGRLEGCLQKKKTHFLLTKREKLKQTVG